MPGNLSATYRVRVDINGGIPRARNARQVDGKQRSHQGAEVSLLYIIESQALPKRLLASGGRWPPGVWWDGESNAYKPQLVHTHARARAYGLAYKLTRVRRVYSDSPLCERLKTDTGVQTNTFVRIRVMKRLKRNSAYRERFMSEPPFVRSVCEGINADSGNRLFAHRADASPPRMCTYVTSLYTGESAIIYRKG